MTCDTSQQTNFRVCDKMIRFKNGAISSARTELRLINMLHRENIISNDGKLTT
jgi:hypothetical protein